jgi:Tfp pilus assembly protein PilF
MNYRKTLVLVSAVLMISLGGLPLHGQQGRGKGRIKGVVTERDTGGPLQGVVVTAISVEYGTKFESKTSAKGTWSIGGLGSGNFKVVYTLPGYIEISQTIVVSQFAINNATLSAELEPVKTSVAAGPEAQNEAAKAVLDEGLRLFDAKDYPGAIQKFREFLALEPSSYQVLMNIGNCYKEMKDYDAALDTYQQVLDRVQEQAPSPATSEARAGAYVGLSDVYLRKGEIDQAERVLQEALARNPNDENLAFKFGEVYFTQGDAAKAAEFYNKAIAANPKWAPPYRQLGYAYLNMGEYARALEMMKKFLELAPNDARAGAVKTLIPQIEKMIK